MTSTDRNSLLLVLAALFALSCVYAPAVTADDTASKAKDARKKAEKKIADALDELPAADKKVATAQRFCAVMPHSRLGGMGTPIKVEIGDQAVFVCCKGCVSKANKGGKTTVRMAKKLTESTATLAKLSPEERRAAEAQKFCAVANTSLLGSMGAPIKLVVSGKPVYLCCEGCEGKAKSDPAATLAKVEKLKQAGSKAGH